MTTRLIVNPSAGSGRARARVDAIYAELAIAWPALEAVESKSAEHVTTLAREAAARGDRTLLVAGGDGTAHYAANGLVGSETALGLLPVGTGNDLPRALGIPSDPRAAVALLRAARPRSIDVGRVGGRVFCCVLGVGMDTEALETIRTSLLPRGRALYTWAALRTLATYRARSMRIDAGGAPFEARVMFAAVTNTATYAGGMRIAPGAEIDDGSLDLCVIEDVGRIRTIARFGRVVSGRHGGLEGVRLARSTRVLIDAEERLPVTLDGELSGLTTPIRIEVAKGALRVLSGQVRARAGARGASIEVHP